MAANKKILAEKASKETHLTKSDSITLDDFVRKITADNISKLSNLARNQLESLLVGIGIFQHQVVLLHMLMEDSNPDLLSMKKLDELIENIKSQIIKITLKREERPDPKPTIRNMNRIISQDETTARFNNMGIDLPQVMAEWVNFYETSRFGKTVKRLYGPDAFDRPYPQLTDGAMIAFEKALQRRSINMIMLDDNRIQDGTTLKSFDRKGLKTFMRQYEIESLNLAKIFLDSTTTTPDVQRLIGLSTKEKIIGENDSLDAFRDQVPNLPFHTAMGLGTYIRLRHFLYENDYGSYILLTSFRHQNSRMILGRVTQLNNRTRGNHILTIGPSADDKTMKEELQIGPSIANAFAPEGNGPIIIVTSDESELIPIKESVPLLAGIH